MPSFIPETSSKPVLASFSVKRAFLDQGEIQCQSGTSVGLAVFVLHQLLPVTVILELSDPLCGSNCLLWSCGAEKHCYLLLSLLERGVSQLDFFFFLPQLATPLHFSSYSSGSNLSKCDLLILSAKQLFVYCSRLTWCVFLMFFCSLSMLLPLYNTID